MGPFGRRESRQRVDLSKPMKFVATTIPPLDKRGKDSPRVASPASRHRQDKVQRREMARAALLSAIGQ